jgi:hypothetical protein
MFVARADVTDGGGGAGLSLCHVARPHVTDSELDFSFVVGLRGMEVKATLIQVLKLIVACVEIGFPRWSS